MTLQHPQRGQQWLETLLPLAGFGATVGLEQPQIEAEFGYWLTIQSADLTAEQVDRLLGSGAAALDAIQYLINATLNIGQDREQQAVYTVELANHRLNRYKELRSLAEQAASQVRQTQAEFVTQALSAAERRMVHTILQDEPDLETFSRGQEPDRRLVVRLQLAEALPTED
ncbi:MAG: RNA-binding protein [Aphanocapsa sp. GSE-SYN-MK-11-07L]|jgi:spoIIIJ-associated protein|nr:RNA-binding protein [Aphanocapsa sp. GSE-SYN-MK-11-07L]